MKGNVCRNICHETPFESQKRGKGERRQERERSIRNEIIILSTLDNENMFVPKRWKDKCREK